MAGNRTGSLWPIWTTFGPTPRAISCRSLHSRHFGIFRARGTDERFLMKRISTIALATALVLAACSGDGEADDSAQPVEVTRSVAAAERGTTTTTTTVAPAETTTTAALAPSTLAFSSSDDVGRLFAVSGDITAVTTAGGDTASSEVSAGTIVQTSSLRSRDDVLWVRIERTDADGGTLGWAPASSLSPTSEAVLTENPAEARQFRQAASSSRTTSWVSSAHRASDHRSFRSRKAR